MRMIEVVVVQDESSHWYVIPKDMSQAFSEAQENIGLLDDSSDEYYNAIESFEKTFNKYRTGGALNNIQLYADAKWRR